MNLLGNSVMTASSKGNHEKGCNILSIGLPRWLSGQESACQAGDAGLIPGLGRSPGEENGYPLHHSCLENSKGRRNWWATVHRGISKSWIWLNDSHFHFLSFLDTCPGVGLLGHMMGLFSVFWGISILFAIVATPIYIPTSSGGGFPFLHTLSSMCYL